MHFINPATKLVIPAAAEQRAGIQKRLCDYWTLAFVGRTGWWISDGLFNCQVNIACQSLPLSIDIQDRIHYESAYFRCDIVMFSPF